MTITGVIGANAKKLGNVTCCVRCSSSQEPGPRSLIFSPLPRRLLGFANSSGCLLLFLTLATSDCAQAGSLKWTQSSSAWNTPVPPAGSNFNSSVRSLFNSPPPLNPLNQHQGITLPNNFPELIKLRALIALAEAGPANYDAVQHHARIPPPKLPTQMTIAEIFAWIDATPGQHHAIGRYQIIPATLRGLVKNTGISTKAQFTPQTQDIFADALIVEAGYKLFRRGDITREVFMDNLSAIWAGLPLSNGLSRYHGIAGNKATMTRAAYEDAMERIFPSTQARTTP
jgi:hypothetical protein